VWACTNIILPLNANLCFFLILSMQSNISYMQLTISNANVQDDAGDEENQQQFGQAMHT